MNEETTAKIKDLEARLGHMWRYLDLATKQSRLQHLDQVMEEGSFWEDQTLAKEIIDERNAIKSWLDPYLEIQKKFNESREMLPEAEELADEGLMLELLEQLKGAERQLGELEVRRMLSGELDKKNCYLAINAGAGGTEACDWCLILSRMYQRWGHKRGWNVEVIDLVEGDVAGYRSITFKLSGEFAYGYAKAERGVHRLVRISPFDSSNRRHTSFASVDVWPEITDEIEIEVRPEEVRIDTFRASGAGGQHVNVTDSAVRLTHLPTGIVVSCQQERSQRQNREMAMKLLKGKLYQAKVMEREAKLKEMAGEKREIGWSSQIRNYVLQPYSLVKDVRTSHETGNVRAVLDGEIDEFVIAFLKEYG
ncbi:MAG: peptide chain release factor 2 [Verrucomicrobia bacterium]|nr:peptide chain release factor 2 [Verrucomicrobiota bacterium]